MADNVASHPLAVYTKDEDCAFRVYDTGGIMVGSVSPIGLGCMSVQYDVTVGRNLVVGGTSRLNGNVGIGTAPNASYKLYVNGKIYCKDEMKVSALNTDTVRTRSINVESVNTFIPDMADYVFQDGYKLRSLENLNVYIKELV